MSLVAYGSSDESEDEQESSPVPQISSKAESKQPGEIEHLQSPSIDISVNAAQVCNQDSIKNQVQTNISGKDSAFSSLPPPKANGPIPALDIIKGEDRSIKKNTVKISVPSLSEFKDDETEPTKKKLKPSAKGSGLFALLPAPRNVFMKETKSSDGSKTQAPLVPRVVSKPPVKPPPVIPKRFLKPEDDSAEDNTEKTQDFFSLGSLNDLPDDVSFDPIGNLGGTSASGLNLPPPVSWGNSIPEPHSLSSQNAMTEEASSANADNDFIPVDNSNFQLSEEALQKLCGRRATRQQQDVEVIDVSGASLLPDPNEWLTKQLTEERQLPSCGFGHRRHDGPTSQQRRKHQITYLAFQAKENELELKNQWSQNRMSRKQTQSKYGF